MDADEILVLENGKIKENGSHCSLIIDENSLYSKLWKAQNTHHSQKSEKVIDPAQHCPKQEREKVKSVQL